MAECPQCQSDADLRLQRRDGEPGYVCEKCGTWVQFGALPPTVPTRNQAQAHKASPGLWPEDFPLDADGKVEEGLVVCSKSGRHRRPHDRPPPALHLDRLPRLVRRHHLGERPGAQGVLAGLALRRQDQGHAHHRRRRDLRPLRQPRRRSGSTRCRRRSGPPGPPSPSARAGASPSRSAPRPSPARSRMPRRLGAECGSTGSRSVPKQVIRRQRLRPSASAACASTSRWSSTVAEAGAHRVDRRGGWRRRRASGRPGRRASRRRRRSS